MTRAARPLPPATASRLAEPPIGQPTLHSDTEDDDSGGGLKAQPLARKCWSQALPLAPTDDAVQYLRRFEIQLDGYPRSLRCHPSLPYYEKVHGKSVRVGSHPALLACVQDRTGRPVNLHRTYLCGGRLAPVREPRKPLLALEDGAAVRLFRPTDMLAITVDIESALAVHVMTSWPVWAALSAQNLQRLALPPDLLYVAIFVSASYDEQAAAFALAARLQMERSTQRAFDVDVTATPGDDMTQAQTWALCRRRGMRTWREREQGARQRRAPPPRSTPADAS